MTVVGSLVVAWAAAHLFAFAQYLAVHLRLRGSPIHLAFSCVSLGQALYNIGAAMALNGTDHGGWFGRHMQTFALPILVTGFVTFVYSFSRKSWSRTGSRSLLAWALLGWAGTALSVAFSPRLHTGSPPASLVWLAATHTTYAAPLWDTALRLSALAITTAALLVSRRAWVGVPGKNFIMLAGLIGTLTFLADTLTRAFGWNTYGLMEHATILSSLAVGHVLLGGFVFTAQTLSQRTVELAQRYEELRRTESELVRNEQVVAVGELSALIAGEIQFPLATISEAVTGLQRPHLSSADEGALLRVLDHETDRLNRLVRTLVRYARPTDAQHVPVVLAPLLRRAVGSARTTAPNVDSVEFELHLDELPETVQGDPDLIEHAITYVAEAAAYWSQAGEPAVIRAAPPGNRDPEGVALQFTYRTSASLPARRRLDPGMSIVNRVLETHGGQLHASSDERGRVTATLVLPAARTAAADHVAEESPNA